MSNRKRRIEPQNERLHATEPEQYSILQVDGCKSFMLGDREHTFGFCVDSPGAEGYHDEKLFWIADQLTDPERAVVVMIHECLHGIFPDLSESETDKAAEQIAAVVVGVFKAKGTAPLPTLKRILTKPMAEALFPHLTWSENP